MFLKFFSVWILYKYNFSGFCKMNECHIIKPCCSLETCLGNTASSPFPAMMYEIRRTWIEAFLGAKCGNALSSKASNLFYVRISFHPLEGPWNLSLQPRCWIQNLEMPWWCPWSWKSQIKVARLSSMSRRQSHSIQSNGY